MSHRPIPSRRQFLASGLALGAVPLLGTGNAFADELTKTPAQTEGPFYPDKLPLDTDNDLIVINDTITPAVGDITHLTGKVMGPDGKSLPGLTVEIWQCDAKGVYLHSRDSGEKKDQQDKHFQGFGRCFTAPTSGAYYFRTIKPVPYPGRTPHIHVAVKQGKKKLLVTQLYVAGHPGNEKDGIWLAVKDAKQRAAITVDFAKVKGSKIGELAATFDIVLGKTPAVD